MLLQTPRCYLQSGEEEVDRSGNPRDVVGGRLVNPASGSVSARQCGMYETQISALLPGQKQFWFYSLVSHSLRAPDSSQLSGHH